MTQPDLFLGDNPPRDLAGCVTEPWQAWLRMQRVFDKAEVKAACQHRAVRPLRARRQAIVHAALAGAVRS